MSRMRFVLIVVLSSVITYTLLSGMMPFPNDNFSNLKRAILRCQIYFTSKYWENVSDNAKDFIKYLVDPDQETRPTALQALSHAWLMESEPDQDVDLPGLRENFNARAHWRSAIIGTIAMNRMRDAGLRCAERRRSQLALACGCGAGEDCDSGSNSASGSGASSDLSLSMRSSEGRGLDESMLYLRQSEDSEEDVELKGEEALGWRTSLIGEIEFAFTSPFHAK